MSKSALLMGLIVLTAVRVAYVCHAGSGVPFAKDSASGPRSGMTTGSENVHVVLICDKVPVSMRDSFTIDIAIRNDGPSPVYLYRIMEWGYGGGLVLHVLDLKGNPVKPRFTPDALLLPPEHEDPTLFVHLDQMMFYGARARLPVRDEIPTPGKYTIYVEYWCPLSRNLLSPKLRSLPILSHEDPSLYSNKLPLEVIP